MHVRWNLGDLPAHGTIECPETGCHRTNNDGIAVLKFTPRQERAPAGSGSIVTWPGAVSVAASASSGSSSFPGRPVGGPVNVRFPWSIGMHTNATWTGRVSFSQHVTGSTPLGPFESGKKLLTEDNVQHFLYESQADLNGLAPLTGFGQATFNSNYHSAVTSHPKNFCNVPDQRSIDRNLILLDKRGGRADDGVSGMLWQMPNGTHLVSFRTLSISLETRRYERHEFINLCAPHQSRSGPNVNEPWASKGKV